MSECIVSSNRQDLKDVQQFYMAKPIKILDLHHHMDRLRALRMSHEDSGKIYTALKDYVVEYEEINQVNPVSRGLDNI